MTFFPGSLLAGLAMPAIWHSRAETGAKFLLAWIVPSWLVFEIVATKLPHYVLPLYPAIAIIVAGVVDHHGLSRRLWLVRGTVWWFLITAMLVTGLIAAHIVDRAADGISGVAVRRCGDDLFVQRVVALYRRRRGALVVARQRRRDPDCRSRRSAPPFRNCRRCFRRCRFRAICAARVARRKSRPPAITNRAWCFWPAPRPQQTDGTGAADFLLGGGCRYAVVEKGAGAGVRVAGG